MTIDGNTVIAMLGVLISALAFVFMRMHEKEIGQLTKDRDEQRVECRAIAERVRLTEIAQVRIEGDARAALQRVDALERVQVPRAEWEQQIESLHSQLDEIVRELRGRNPGRYSSSDPAMPAQGRRTTP